MKDRELRLEQLYSVLHLYRKLLDAYMVDFFVEDLWLTLPCCWREFFDRQASWSWRDLAEFMDCEEKPAFTVKSVWPLSLLSLRRCAQLLTIPRRSALLDGIFAGGAEEERKLSTKMRVGLKPKKVHEIERLLNLMARLKRARALERVVDVGGGLGHLSRLLSLQLGLTVVSIEANPLLSARARQLDDRLRRRQARKDQSVASWKGPDHQNSVIKMWPAGDSQMWNDGEGNQCLLGLHACGDLSVAQLQEFVSNPKMTSLVSTGCCYMKLNGGRDRDSFEDFSGEEFEPSVGYPLSAFARSRPTHRLSYSARELACHALEQFLDKLKTGDVEHLRVHCYRALLELLILRRHPARRKLGFGSLKNAHRLQFKDYCCLALKKRPDLLPVLEDISEDLEAFLKSWHKVVVFYCLRTFLAPLIESSILLDRVLFLEELTAEDDRVFVFPLFDCKISARNIAIVSIRHCE